MHKIWGAEGGFDPDGHFYDAVVPNYLNPDDYHTHGGSVTNVGDINVSVTGGGGSARQTGRSIATELRRELRRGSSIL